MLWLPFLAKDVRKFCAAMYSARPLTDTVTAASRFEFGWCNYSCLYNLHLLICIRFYQFGLDLHPDSTGSGQWFTTLPWWICEQFYNFTDILCSLTQDGSSTTGGAIHS